jgi:hypothetical protein
MARLSDKHVLFTAVSCALLALVAPSVASAQMFLGNAFGQCAVQENPETKISACTMAAKATPYPWVLNWVYRELARAYRDRGDPDQAAIYYARSLATKEDDVTRREMESLPSRSLGRISHGGQARR